MDTSRVSRPGGHDMILISFLFSPNLQTLTTKNNVSAYTQTYFRGANVDDEENLMFDLEPRRLDSFDVAIILQNRKISCLFI